MRVLLSLLLLFVSSANALESRSFTTSDGVRLHYVEAGRGRTLVFVPGWTMPGWVFTAQLEHFAREYRVVALDPRSQGRSQIAASGHEPTRRGADIAELVARLGGEPVALVGWSLGVLDSLAYIERAGDAQVAALVLVDNSVGEEPPPVYKFNIIAALRKDRERTVRNFVRSMFKQPQSEAYLERLTRAALVTPLPAAIELLSYPKPREYWREALYRTAKPVLYVVTPQFAAQAGNLQRKHPAAETIVFEQAGHALFVDEPQRFNRHLTEFLRDKVWN